MSHPWDVVTDSRIRQGDFIINVLVPIIPPDFPDKKEIETLQVDALVVSHSCDLDQGKIDYVSIVGAMEIEEAISEKPDLKGKLEEVKKGRLEHLFLLPPLKSENWGNAIKWIIVDFRDVYSVPLPYLVNVEKKLL